MNPNELERGPFNPDEDDEMFPEPSPFNPDEDTVPFPQPSDPDEDPMPDELGPVPFSPDEEEMPFLEPAQLGPDELPSEMDAMILETEKCNTNPCAPGNYFVVPFHMGVGAIRPQAHFTTGVPMKSTFV